MKTLLTFLLTIAAFTAQAQFQISAPGVKWEESYTFDKCNIFKVEFYRNQNELVQTLDYKTCYQSNGKDFIVILTGKYKGDDLETIFDLKNEVAIQIFGSDASEPMYNAGRFKYPAAEDLKKLEISPASETRTIAGFLCKKYTYFYKKIFGSVWITDQVALPNDYGIFRAAKMSALHNTLSVEGFVLEMTTEDAKGGKTVLTTVSIGNDEKFTKDLRKVKMNTALNKVSYYTF